MVDRPICQAAFWGYPAKMAGCVYPDYQMGNPLCRKAPCQIGRFLSVKSRIHNRLSGPTNCSIVIFLCAGRSGTNVALPCAGDNRGEGHNGCAWQNSSIRPLGNRAADRHGIRRIGANAGLHRRGAAGQPARRRPEDRALREARRLARPGGARHREALSGKPQIPRRSGSLVHPLHAPGHDGPLRHQAPSPARKGRAWRAWSCRAGRQVRRRTGYPRERVHFRVIAAGSRSFERSDART